MTTGSSALEELKNSLAPGVDRDYFAFHEPRFERELQRICQIAPPGARILDVGSHYLHMSAALSASGFDVTALDVPEFQNLPAVTARAQRYSVQRETVTDLGKGDFLAGIDESSFDLVLFCEVVEHFAFNPVRMWRRVYELLRVNGNIYITTPNSLRITNVVKTASRLAARRGVGIPVEEILGFVTYGHHWKEYSAGELRAFFAALSPDFQPEIAFVDFGFVDQRDGAGHRLGRTLSRVAGIVPSFRPHLEVVVHLQAKSRWLARSDHY